MATDSVFSFPLLLEVGDELVERLLLVLRLQRLPDGLLGLLERLLRGLGDLLDLEHVASRTELREAFELEEEDLNLSLGPLGNLL